MKYIKTYEAMKNPYKKYVVWEKQDGSKILLIAKIIGVEEPVKPGAEYIFKIEFLYTYNNDIFEVSKPRIKPHHLYNKWVDNHVIFTSDNIEDCEKQIILLSTENKYNL